MVKCTDCGFLSPYSEDGEEIVYADNVFRHEGHPLVGRVVRTFPICLKHVINLPAIVEAQDNGTLHTMAHDSGPGIVVARQIPYANPEVVATVSQLERPCDKWTEWQQGFSLKEHQEMLDRQWMIDRADRLDREMREREDRRDQLADARHQADLKLAKDMHWQQLAVLGFFIAAISLFGSLVQAGWITSFGPFTRTAQVLQQVPSTAGSPIPIVVPAYPGTDTGSPGG